MNRNINKSIEDLTRIEKRYSKYFYKSDFDFRESVIARAFNSIVKKSNVFKKSINNLNIYFPNSSKISREFLLSAEKFPDHIWEPQTHKLLKILCKNKKNIFFGGAFFGDHACLISKKFKKSMIYCFEPLPKTRHYLKKNKVVKFVRKYLVITKYFRGSDPANMLLRFNCY